MPRPKTISDDEILSIARRCFQKHGHSISTREIAKEVGISQSVLYQRFGGKEQMFLRAMMPEPPDVEALLDRPDGLSAREYVLLITRRLVAHFQTLIPALLHLLTYPNFDISHVEGAHDHLMADRLQQELVARFQALVESGELEAHSGEALATTVLGLAHAIGMHSTMRAPSSTHDPSSVDEAALAPLVGVLWRGMEPRDP